MSPLVILLVGLCTVVGTILLLRLHAFLALVLGAFVVGLLTPESAVLMSRLRDRDVQFDARLLEAEHRVQVATGGSGDGEPLVCVRVQPDRTVRLFELVPADPDSGRDDTGERVLRLSPEQIAAGGFQDGDVVVRAADYRAAAAEAARPVIGRLTVAFGNTCGKIGLLIAMASIIGFGLQASGAAQRIVGSMLQITGERGAPLGFMLSGFLLGIPVFFDTVFYLMIPLGQALHRQTGRSYLLYVLSIVAGATMAHSLVPPTPGPLLVAEELGVETATMIFGGCVVGLFTLVVGGVWAVVVSRRCTLSPPADAVSAAAVPVRLPPLWLSLLPIVLPVVLIAAPLILRMLDWQLSPSAQRIVSSLGDRNIALALAAACALGMVLKYADQQACELRLAIERALGSAGVIILITAAGGAFGAMLRTSGLDVSELVSSDASAMMLITLAFVVTTVIRTAQGSATVAMITAAGVFGPIVATGDLPFDPVYLALAIGCGSKPIAWMNDSGFWIITRLSGMTETEGLKYVTPMTALMGLSGLLVLLAGVSLLPVL